jgi:hypothetical protein
VPRRARWWGAGKSLGRGRQKLLSHVLDTPGRPNERSCWPTAADNGRPRSHYRSGGLTVRHSW